jgi:uncharacterized membrane-anchored protein
MHPLRERLHNELHARPSIHFSEPAHLHHYAFLDEDGVAGALLGDLADCTGQAPDGEAVQKILELDGMTLKWERHTEFFTLTLRVPCGCPARAATPAGRRLPSRSPRSPPGTRRR